MDTECKRSLYNHVWTMAEQTWTWRTNDLIELSLWTRTQKKLQDFCLTCVIVGEEPTGPVDGAVVVWSIWLRI